MKYKNTYKYEKIDIGETVLLVPVNKKNSSKEALVLNEMGKIVWDSLDHGLDIDVIINKIANTTNGAVDTIESDVQKFINKLVEHNAIQQI